MGRTRKYIQTNISTEIKQTSLSNKNNENIENVDDLENTNIIDISSLKKKEKMLYDVLNDFYAKCSNEEIKVIIEIINGKYKISLRFLDWFVTRYCYLYKTSIQLDNIHNKEQDFNINISYKAQLKSFKKKCFDPFKRKKKFYYTFNRDNIEYHILTTLGQLNFFKWALGFGIIKYVEVNFDKINCKINYVNSFFKKNIIDNNTLSLVSSDELRSKSSNLNVNSSHISETSSIENNFLSKSIKKKSHNYNPIVSRNIFVEL